MSVPQTAVKLAVVCKTTGRVIRAFTADWYRKR